MRLLVLLVPLSLVRLAHAAPDPQVARCEKDYGTRAAGATVCKSVIAATPPTAGSVSDSIRQEGAKRTIDDLAAHERWDFVTQHMDAGDAAWIALAPRLAPGSDAGSAEDLGISLAVALPKNPRAVLAALDPANSHVLGAERVCGMPFIEDTVKDRPAYRRRAIAAVRAVSDPKLAGAKAACLRELDASR